MLMCLAEALLRIPDADTADKLIADKIAIGQWSDYLGEADSLFVNASTWGLMLTGKLVRESELEIRDPATFLRRLVARLGEPVVRTAFRQAMRIMGRQFVMGRDIGEALERADAERGRALPPHLRHAGRVRADRNGRAALPRVLPRGDRGGRPLGAPGQPARRLAERLGQAFGAASALRVRARSARSSGSSGRGSRSLALAREVRRHRAHGRRGGGGAARALAAAASTGCSKRPRSPAGTGSASPCRRIRSARPDVLRYLQRRADATARVLNLRLVKGAYWDSEVKRAQERGLPGYPVYTRKANTDVAYLACARILLEGTRRVYPQFATHNAHTAASIIHLARAERPRVRVPAPARHGRGALRGAHRPGRPRAAVPRLCAGRLARGAAAVPGAPPARERREHFVREPHRRRVAAGRGGGRRPGRGRRARGQRPAPADPAADAGFSGPSARNSAGINLPDGVAQRQLAAACREALARPLRARPIVGGEEQDGERRSCRSPGGPRRASSARRPTPMPRSPRRAIELAAAAQPDWDRVPAANAGAHAARRGRSPRARHRKVRGDLRRRGGQDRAGLDRRGARGGRFPALLRGACRGDLRQSRCRCRVRPANRTG